MFDCGDNTTNLHDNTVNDDDRLIINLLGFVSNNGSSLISVQVSWSLICQSEYINTHIVAEGSDRS